MTLDLEAIRKRDEAAPAWRCFHCDEVFVTVESAREHFGSDCLCTPGCCIDITEYRRMEAAHQSHLDETDAGSRHYFALQALHREALKREEEKGYARGIDDMRAELTSAESALAALRAENERLREGCRLYDLALKEAEAILGGEYDLRHGPLFDMAEAACALVERGAQ